MNIRRRIGALVGTLLAGPALVLAGCSSGSSPSTVEQTLIVAPLMFPSSLDVQQFPAEEGIQLAAEQVLDTLVTAEDGTYVPRLAESWSNPDPNTWVFNLRPDVVFSDGTPFTSKDVTATIERHLSINSVLAPLLASITSMDDSDPNTLTIKTDPPLGTLLGTLSLLYVGKADSIDDESYWLKPIGTGPFKIDSYTPDDEIVFSPNENYWGTPPKLTSLTFKDIPEAATRVTGLLTGEIDVVTNIAPDQIEEVRGADGLTLDTVPSYLYWMNWFNHGREPFDDARVRQALWYALDLNTIIPSLFGDTASVAVTPLAQTAFGAPELEPYPYDPARAKQLLAEAGLPNGFSTELMYPNDAGANVDQLVQAFVSAWAEIGVTVTPVRLERANWVADLNALNWDMTLFVNSTATGDADYTLGRLYKSTSKRLGFSNADVDAWIDEEQQTVDQDQRAAAFEKIATYLWENAVAIWPAQMKGNVAYKADIQGLEMPSSGRIVFATVSRG